MAEAVKPTVEELEAEIERMQGELQRIIQIANMYIKAHRDLLTQVKTAVDTSGALEVMLSEKLK
jgi:phage host-nuclease inhibitor protein Gam